MTRLKTQAYALIVSPGRVPLSSPIWLPAREKEISLETEEACTGKTFLDGTEILGNPAAFPFDQCTGSVSLLADAHTRMNLTISSSLHPSKLSSSNRTSKNNHLDYLWDVSCSAFLERSEANFCSIWSSFKISFLNRSFRVRATFLNAYRLCLHICSICHALALRFLSHFCALRRWKRYGDFKASHKIAILY